MSRTFGIVVLVSLAVVVVLVLFDGWSLGHWTVVAALLLFGLGAWLTMVRPTLHVHDDHVLVRNALSDTRVPWHLVESVEVRQVLVIHTEDRVVHGLAVGRTARQQLRHGRRGSSSGSQLVEASTLGGDSAVRVNYADFVAERLGDLASKHRTSSDDRARLDKQWRLAEVAAVVGVTAAFGLLLAIAIAA